MKIDPCGIGEARALLREALAQNDSSAEAYYLRGVLQEMEGDTIHARESYECSLAADPTHQRAGQRLCAMARSPLPAPDEECRRRYGLTR